MLKVGETLHVDDAVEKFPQAAGIPLACILAVEAPGTISLAGGGRISF